MPSAAPVGVLALQGDIREHTRVLTELGADVRPVRLPEDLEQVGSLVLPGGESTTMSILLGTSGLLQPLRARLGQGMPALGTCAGMILLARRIVDGRDDQVHLDALDVTVRRNAFGRQVDSFETDLDVAGLEEPMHAVFIRAPVIEAAGPAVEVLASVPLADGVRRPVVCRQGRVLAASFHPELTGDRRLHELFLDQVLAPVSSVPPGA